jgi:hypothetical protein
MNFLFTKGAICIWIDIMVAQSIMKNIKDREIYAKFLSIKIKNFSISGSTFAKSQKRAEKIYGNELRVHTL